MRILSFGTKTIKFYFRFQALETVITPLQRVAIRNRGVTFNRRIMAIESQPVSMPQHPLGQRVVLSSTVIIRLFRINNPLVTLDENYDVRKKRTLSEDKNSEVVLQRRMRKREKLRTQKE